MQAEIHFTGGGAEAALLPEEAERFVQEFESYLLSPRANGQSVIIHFANVSKVRLREP
jgi:hypothetical protein